MFTVGRWVKDRLLMFDLGYYRYQLFDRIDQHGGIASRADREFRLVGVRNAATGRYHL